MMKIILTNLSFVLGLLISTVSIAEVIYVHNDVLGSPIMETDAQGNILSQQHYKPFGETLETPKDDVGYTGHLNDTDLGLTYMQARYYDPVIGRFYSNDPIGFRDIHSFNRYAYANNNPYKYTDPTGQASENSYINRPKGVTIKQNRDAVSNAVDKVAGATTVKVGVGIGAQIKANVPSVGNFEAGGSAAISSVMTSDLNAQGIELNADAGVTASNSSGTMTGKAQLGKVETLIQPQNGTATTKTEGAKLSGSLTQGSGSVDNSGKAKFGGHFGIIKVEVEVDTSKL
jgi:RHS repeat-associated protein